MAEVSAPKILIYLLRRDLRLSDNPVFHRICSTFHSNSASKLSFTHLLPLYIFPADQIEVSGFLAPSTKSHIPKSPFPEARSRIGNFWRCGPHRARFIGESVWDLKERLERHGSGMSIHPGRYADVIHDALNFYSQDPSRGEVVGLWMTSEEPAEEKAHEAAIRNVIGDRPIDFKVFKDEKYFIDDDILPFPGISDLPDVFTTFRKSLEPLRNKPLAPLPEPDELPPFPTPSQCPPVGHDFSIPSTEDAFIDALLKPLGQYISMPLPPVRPADDIAAYNAHPFRGGETSALDRLTRLIATGAMSSYKDTRNGLVGTEFSTKLSGFLSLGCITARQIHADLVAFEDGTGDFDDSSYRYGKGFGEGENEGTKGVRFELLWRDYMRLCARKFNTKLFHRDGFRGMSDNKKWKSQVEASADGEAPGLDTLSRFLSGHTGIGLIDASQRELYWTGYTSNRARQNVASFLAKHLNIDWRIGAEWYECMLIDYDAASNWGNWQYVAGVGNDPREGRIFNPVKQALDYDPKGEYIMTWIPELRRINIHDETGSIDQEKMMGLFQAWRLTEKEKQQPSLAGRSWVVNPLLKIEFSVARKPRHGTRGRGSYRGRGGTNHNYRGRGQWPGRGGPHPASHGGRVSSPNAVVSVMNNLRV